MEDKKCISCKQYYSISNYYSDGRGGRKPRCKTCHKKRFKDSPRDRWKKYAWDAKRRSIAFNLSEEEFSSFAETPCFYCGTAVYPIRLDRINNVLGYNIFNVVSCCHLCNSFKHTFTEENFIKHIKIIYLYQQRLSDMRKTKQTQLVGFYNDE